MESDWELEESDPESEIEIGSDIEDDGDCGVEDGENSPRISVGSVSWIPPVYPFPAC